jgi:hypothetical protein
VANVGWGPRRVVARRGLFLFGCARGGRWLRRRGEWIKSSGRAAWRREGGLLRATCVLARAPARAIRTVGWGGTLCGFDDAQQDEMLWIRSILSRLFRSFQFMMEQTRKLQKSTVDIRAFQGGGTSTSNGERIISISHYSYANFTAVSRSIEI